VVSAPTPQRTRPQQNRLAEAREHFLSNASVEPGRVRDPIFASWLRSRRWRVAADHVEPRYQADFQPDTMLARIGLPVLRRLQENLDGQRISVILTDAEGVVLSRMTTDPDFERHLDRVQLAPGFSYSERLVGTNGIGTALECGRAIYVFGHEHYAEHLEDLACAAAPIRHPLTGRTVGIVDLTCLRVDAGPLLIALAKTTAEQIQQALAADSSPGALQLFEEYLHTCKRTGGIVFAVGKDVVVLNDHARQLLDPVDQSLLLEQASETLTEPPTRPPHVTLSSGAEARLYSHPIREADLVYGAVVEVKLSSAGYRHTGDGTPPAGQGLPGLVGSGSLWLRGCSQVESAYESGEWVALEGERGVGKLAVLRAIHQAHNPAARFRVIEAEDVAGSPPSVQLLSELLDGAGGVVVVRHIDRLGAVDCRKLADELQAARADPRERPAWVAVTSCRATAKNDQVELLRFFPRTVEIAPLRHHIDDLAELVPFLLRRLNRIKLVCSADAIKLMMRSNWPGNTQQVCDVLNEVAHHRRTGVIQPDELPPECQTVSRRVLSPLESMERDAIVRALLSASGRKDEAARSLGMSRATIYRKIHEYGIVTRANLTHIPSRRSQRFRSQPVQETPAAQYTDFEQCPPELH
jgi:transcriptional regulator of acetoin/glycerol metabolism